MSYLDRLKGQNSEKQATKALSKLPKAPYDSFGSSQGGLFSENESLPETAVKPESDDDRHHCHECRHLSNAGYCIQQRFRPVDDIPRRCEDFSGYPDRIGQNASNTQPAPAPDPLMVGIYTPSGTPMMTRADNAEHAAWLRQMNPKPADPAPKPDLTPEPNADRISEAEYNAQGLFFKWLITRPNGSQFYSCSMPRQTLAEVRTQYPDATHIQPVEGEDYPHD